MMSLISSRSRSLIVAVGAALAISALYFSWSAYLRNPKHRLPYHDSFASGKADEWRAFGGTWAITDGMMRNDSDERGAKLLAGSVYWEDYVLTGDVKLVGRDGDAGLIVRSSNEEEGVDSYSGYYAGLRTRDNRLVLGRANHDWKEVQSVALPGGMQAFQWYHLEIVAYQCQIVVSASPLLNSDSITAVALTDKGCARSGRIGLRSYSSGGAWKDIHARIATPSDLHEALARIPVQSAESQSGAGSSNMPFFGSGSRPSTINLPLPSPASAVQTISSLRLASPQTSATIRGVVILTTPAVYVQDSTGGVSVTGDSLTPAKIGDEVQVTGHVESGYYSSHLRHSTLSALWSHPPVPPFSITSGQAASGAFDSMYVELEGSLRNKTWGPANSIVLDLESDQQPFQAIVSVGRGDRLFRKMEPHSIVRLRGICVVDPEYTHNRLPFVLLLRSADDLEVLSGPPWWNTRHIIFLSFCILILFLIAHFIQNRIERWRWRSILEERENLAHEIHDTLAQSFAGLGFQLEAIRDRVPDDIPAVHQQLDLACDLVRRSHQEARRSIIALRRNSADDIELLGTLERCAQKMVDHCGVEVTATQTGNARALPPTLGDALFRIGQEAIANSVRHAQPTRIIIRVDYSDERIRLIVEDNGVGFLLGHEAAGFGLEGFQKRARSISGTAQVISSPGAGTRVEISAPIPPRLRWIEWPKHLWHIYWRYRSDAQARKQMHSGAHRG